MFKLYQFKKWYCAKNVFNFGKNICPNFVLFEYFLDISKGFLNIMQGLWKN